MNAWLDELKLPAGFDGPDQLDAFLSRPSRALAADLAATPDVAADARGAWQTLFSSDHFRDRRRSLFALLPQAALGTGANLRKEHA